MFLVIVDAYTKWLEVRYMTSATSASVIRELRALFATFGLPRKVVSDNGSVFVSSVMTDFYQKNGIQAVTSAPYHPATNGQAERFVYELKQGLARDKKGLLSLRVARLLYKQHTTVSTSTGKTPAFMMFGRELATNLSRLMPSPERERQPQEKMPASKAFKEGEPVVVVNFRGTPRWIDGTLVKKIGYRSWLIETAWGRIRRHLNHIRRRSSSSTSPAAWEIDGSDRPDVCRRPQDAPPQEDPAAGDPGSVATEPRRINPPRSRRPPDRYGDYV